MPFKSKKKKPLYEPPLLIPLVYGGDYVIANGKYSAPYKITSANIDTRCNTIYEIGLTRIDMPKSKADENRFPPHIIIHNK